MRKWTTGILLLFLATVVGAGIWYYFQKDYPPALKESKDEAEVQLHEEPLPEGQLSEERLPEGQLSEERLPEDSVSGEQLSPDNDWGVVLTAEDVTPDGMTLVCTQSGGFPSGELNTGAWYELEKKTEDEWIPSEQYAEVCWEDLAWMIPAEERIEWDVNWTWIYGTLAPGEYRIVKELMDFRQPGDYDTCRSYAYFTIE